MVSDKSWAFEPALAFLESESGLVVHSDIPLLDEPAGKTDSGHLSDSDGSDGGVTLGSFARVYRHLGVANVAPPDSDYHKDEDDSAESTLVTSPPPLVLDVSDEDNDTSSGTESASGLATVAVDIEVLDSAAVAVGKHHKTNKKKKEKKKKRALAAQEKTLVAQTVLGPDELVQDEPSSTDASTGKRSQQPIVATGQAAPVPERPLVTNPLQFLSKGQTKDKKSAATVAVAPPVADNITPALASYVERSDRPAVVSATEETKKPAVPGSSGEQQKASRKRSSKNVEVQHLPQLSVPGGQQDLPAEQLPISTAGPSFQPPSHHLISPTPQRVQPLDFLDQQSTVDQMLQMHQPLLPNTGKTYLAPGQQVSFNASVPYPLPQQQLSGVPYYILPGVHVPDSSHLAPSLAAAGLQPINSASQDVPSPDTQNPLAGRTSRIIKHLKFLQKLVLDFPEDAEQLVAPMRLKTHDDPSNPQGIHVFIDASNILIGFRDFMRQRGVKNPELCISSLFLLLERARPVAKRVYVGSRRSDAPMLSHEKHTELATAVGYETNIYERVKKAKEKTERQMFHDDAQRYGYTRAGQLQAQRREAQKNGSATAPHPQYQFQYLPNAGFVNGAGNPEMGTRPASPSPTPKWVEQGVDELIQLKMMHSLWDTQTPSTMVLATGDGAEAEFSDGFFAHVMRALRGGWRVELVTWRKQTNCEYKKREFREAWGDQFRIIELDGWWEGLMESVG